MGTGSRIKELRLQLGLSQKELGDKVGLKTAAIHKYENGIVINLKRSMIDKLADALNCSPVYLMGWEDRQDEDTRELTPLERIVAKLPLVNAPVSAGSGQWLAEGYEYEFCDFENAPADADFALRVRGDSMAPLYCDDDIIFVKACVQVEGGQVGVFFLNGEGYMKMLQGSKLVSLNPEYKAIVINEFDSFFICGRVIGKAK